MKITRQDGETAKAYDACMDYLLLGPQRSLTTLAAKVVSNRERLGAWSTKFGWVDRANAWDESAASERLKVARREQISAQKRQESRRELLRDDLEVMGRKMREKLGPALENWEPDNVPSAIRAYVELMDIVMQLGAVQQADPLAEFAKMTDAIVLVSREIQDDEQRSRLLTQVRMICGEFGHDDRLEADSDPCLPPTG